MGPVSQNQEPIRPNQGYNGTQQIGGVLAVEERFKGFQASRFAFENGLGKIIRDSLNLSRSFNFPESKNIKVAQSEEDFIRSFFLRSIIYSEKGYDLEFEGARIGLDYDKHDAKSLTFVTKHQGQLTSSFRIVLDSELGFPSEKYCRDIEEQRDKGRKIAEISRLVISPEYRSTQTFLRNMVMCTLFAEMNEIDEYIYCAEEPNVDIFGKYITGQKILRDGIRYGSVESPLCLVSWTADDVREDIKNRMGRNL